MRRQDWQLRFAEFATARRSMPFEWGKNDCCLFAADAVLAMTGKDPAEPLRGYSSALAAQRLIDEAGGLHELASRFLGKSVSPLMAGTGDVALLLNEGRELLAVCNGANAIGPGPHGMAVLGMESALAAWKV